MVFSGTTQSFGANCFTQRVPYQFSASASAKAATLMLIVLLNIPVCFSSQFPHVEVWPCGGAGQRPVIESKAGEPSCTPHCPPLSRAATSEGNNWMFEYGTR